MKQVGVLPPLLEAPMKFLMCHNCELINEGPPWDLQMRGAGCLAQIAPHMIIIHPPHWNSHTICVSPLPVLRSEAFEGALLQPYVCVPVCVCSLTLTEEIGGFNRSKLLIYQHFPFSSFIGETLALSVASQNLSYAHVIGRLQLTSGHCGCLTGTLCPNVM